MIEIITGTHLLEKLCSATKKWGLYISEQGFTESFEEITRAAPYLGDPKFEQVLLEGFGYLLFDTEAEMNTYYDMTVGDDGPTKTNPYTGSARIYALTCSPDGQTQNENT